MLRGKAAGLREDFCYGTCLGSSNITFITAPFIYKLDAFSMVKIADEKTMGNVF